MRRVNIFTTRPKNSDFVLPVYNLLKPVNGAFATTHKGTAPRPILGSEMENLRKNHAQAIIACDLDHLRGEPMGSIKTNSLRQHVYCFERQAAALVAEPEASSLSYSIAMPRRARSS